jgi:hypothetical protein
LLFDALDKKPMIQVFKEYYDVFKCMEVLVRDDHNSEDVKKVDGDDAFDMLKYGLTNMKKPENKPKGEKSKHPAEGLSSI